VHDHILCLVPGFFRKGFWWSSVILDVIGRFSGRIFIAIEFSGDFLKNWGLPVVLMQTCPVNYFGCLFFATPSGFAAGGVL